MSETSKFPSHKLDATEIIGKLATSDEFQHNLDEGYSTQRALARGALELAGMNPTEFQISDDEIHTEDEFEPRTENLTQTSALNALVGAMPSFVHGLEGIDHHQKTGELGAKEFRSMKWRTARFNHTLKALIDLDSSLDFDNITDTATTMYGVLNRDRWGDDRNGYEGAARSFRKRFEGVLRGMQQEVVARQVIETINQTNPSDDAQPRVIVSSHVSVEDDLKGVDLYVTLDGVTFPVDIKASERTADSARKKSSHPASIITSGINSHRLNGSFVADPFLARRAAPDMLKKLYTARAEFLAKQKPTTSSRTLRIAA